MSYIELLLQDGRPENIFDVADCLKDTIAQICALVTITQLDGFVVSFRST